MYRSDNKAEEERQKMRQKNTIGYGKTYITRYFLKPLSLYMWKSVSRYVKREEPTLHCEGGMNQSIYSVNSVLIGTCVCLPQISASPLPSNSILRQRWLKRSLGLSGKATFLQIVFSQLLLPQGLY
jgi:hypothetical protein